MKTSLFVMGLPLLFGCLGSAHASAQQDTAWNTQTNTRPTLPNAAKSADLDADLLGSLMASGKLSPAETGGSATDRSTPSASTGTQPSTHASTRSRQAHSNSKLLPTIVSAIDTDDGHQPAVPSSTQRHPYLGWQSLLPGSIQ